MKASTDRILTTHVGSLPRSKAVTDTVFAQERGEQVDDAATIIRNAVDDVVARQVKVGIDIVSDGEMSKDQLRDLHQGSHHGFRRRQ